MSSLADSAAFFRLGIAVELLSHSDAIRWGEGVIAAMENPPIEIIELVLLRDSQAAEIESGLNRMSAPERDHAISLIMAVIDHLAGDPSLDTREGAELAYAVAGSSPKWESDWNWRVWWSSVDDDDNANGSPFQISQELETEFRDYLARVRPLWPEAAAILGIDPDRDGLREMTPP